MSLIAITITAQEKGSYDPIPATGVIVQSHVTEFNVRRAEAFRRSQFDFIAANRNSLICGEPASGCPIPIAIRVVVPALVIGNAQTWSPVTLTTAPRDVKGVSFRTVIGIIDAYDGGAATAWIANQLLPSATVPTLKSKFTRVRWHPAGTLKTAPLRRPARDIVQCCCIPVDLNLSGSIYNHFDGAFAPVTTTAAHYGSPAWIALGIGCYRNSRQYCHAAKQFVHVLHPRWFRSIPIAT